MPGTIGRKYKTPDQLARAPILDQNQHLKPESPFMFSHYDAAGMPGTKSLPRPPVRFINPLQIPEYSIWAPTYQIQLEQLPPQPTQQSTTKLVFRSR